MTTLPTEETIAELTSLHLDGDLPEDMICMRCRAMCAKNLGDEQTQLCHDCAHWVVDQVPALLSASSRALELEAFLREHGERAGEALLYMANEPDGPGDPYRKAADAIVPLLGRLNK